eukprot:jgi/Mesvir1/13940/Mv11558-RA.3
MATRKLRASDDGEQYPRYMDPTLASMSARERIEQSAKLLGELQSDFKAGLRGAAAPSEAAPKKVKPVPVVSEGARFLTPTQSSQKLLGPASPSAKAAVLRPPNPLSSEKKWHPASKAAVITDDTSVSKVPATTVYKNVQPRYMNKPQPPTVRAQKAASSSIPPVTTPNTGKVRKRVGGTSTTPLSKSVDLGDIQATTSPSPRSTGGKTKSAKTLEDREPWHAPKAWEKPTVFSDKPANEVQSRSPRVLAQLSPRQHEEDGSSAAANGSLFSDSVILMDNEASLMDHSAITPTSKTTEHAFPLSPVKLHESPSKPSSSPRVAAPQQGVTEIGNITPTASATARAATPPPEDRPVWHAPTEQDRKEAEEAARRTRERMMRYAEEHGFVKPKANRVSASSTASAVSDPGAAPTNDEGTGVSSVEDGGEAEVTSKLSESAPGGLDLSFKIKGGADGAAGDQLEDIVAAAQQAMDAAREAKGLSPKGPADDGASLNRDFSFGINTKSGKASTEGKETSGRDGPNGSSESVFTPRSIASLKTKKPRTGPLINVDQLLVSALKKAADKGVAARDTINYHPVAFILSMLCLLGSILLGVLGVIVMFEALGVAALAATGLASGRAALLAAGAQLQAKVAPALATVKGRMSASQAAMAASATALLAKLASLYDGASSAINDKAGALYSGAASAATSAGASVSSTAGSAYSAVSDATSGALASMSGAATGGIVAISDTAQAGLARGKELLARVTSRREGGLTLDMATLKAYWATLQGHLAGYRATAYKRWRRAYKLARKAWRARMKQHQITPAQEQAILWALAAAAALLVIGTVALVIALWRRSRNRRRKAAAAKKAAEEAKKAEAARAAAIEAAQAKAEAALARAAAEAKPRGGQGLTAALRQDDDTSDSDFAPDEAVDVTPVPLPPAIKVDARGLPGGAAGGMTLAEAARPSSTYVDSSDEMPTDSDEDADDEEEEEDKEDAEETLPAESESTSVATKDDVPEGQFVLTEAVVEDEDSIPGKGEQEQPQEVVEEAASASKNARDAPDGPAEGTRPLPPGSRQRHGSSGDSFDPFNSGSGSGGPWALSPFAETAAQMQREVDREYQTSGLGKELVGAVAGWSAASVGNTLLCTILGGMWAA